MSDYPAITVLLPVYFPHVSAGLTLLLKRALESVADQDYPGSIEVLVIDDGSPYSVRDVYDSLGSVKSIVKWKRLKNNLGIVGALNTGISIATSPLIARLDADDTWLDGKLESQVNQFLEDSDLTISATGMVRVDTSGVEIDRHIRPGDWEGILEFFVKGGCPFPHGSVVASRVVFQWLGGYPWSAAVRHCEDYALWGIWLRFFKPAMIEKVLYSYRVSESSVSAEFGGQQSAASQKVRKKFEDLGLGRILPQALPALSLSLGASLVEAGMLAYRAWFFRAPIAVPADAVGPLTAILPDRILTRVAKAPHWRSVIDGIGRDIDGFVSLQADGVM